MYLHHHHNISNSNGNRKIVEMLVTNGANIDLKDTVGKRREQQTRHMCVGMYIVCVSVMSCHVFSMVVPLVILLHLMLSVKRYVRVLQP